MSDKKEISWEDFHSDTKELSKKIKAMNLSIKGIVSITRGGLVPTAIVASELNIRKIESFGFNTYSDEMQQRRDYEVLCIPEEAIADKGKGWIIIDELVDTGHTANYIKQKLPEAKMFAVYTKMMNCDLLEDFVKYYDKSYWICFPWEIK